MAILSEILALLDKWPEWKRVRQAPDRIDALEKRLAALEATTPEQAGEPCPACGKPAMRRTSQEERKLAGHLVGVTDVWTCSACGAVDRRSKRAQVCWVMLRRSLLASA